MYDNQDHPTMELATVRRDSRPWLVIGAVLTALTVVLLAGAVACRGSSGDPVAAPAGTSPPAGATTPSPAEGEDDEADGDSGDQADPAGGGQPAGGQPGGQPGGGPGAEPEDPPAPESPAPREVTVTVADPPVTPGCTATGRITVTGGEYPVELTYRWYLWRVVNGIPLLLPLSDPQVTTLDEPGQVELTSPDFPSHTSENPVQLRVDDSGQMVQTPLVTYPACHQPGFTS